MHHTMETMTSEYVQKFVIKVVPLTTDFQIVLPCVFGALLGISLILTVFYHNVGKVMILGEDADRKEMMMNSAWYEKRGYMMTEDGKVKSHHEMNDSIYIYTSQFHDME